MFKTVSSQHVINIQNKGDSLLFSPMLHLCNPVCILHLEQVSIREATVQVLNKPLLASGFYPGQCSSEGNLHKGKES